MKKTKTANEITETTRFDAAEYLDTPDAIAAYMEDAFASGDIAEITDALGVVARAHGMSDIAEKAGMSRTSLYRALGPNGNAELSTFVKVMNALGLRLAAVPSGKTPAN
jgi:probable addiction module antidote protein